MYNLQTKIEILTRNPKYMYMYMYRMTIIHTSNVQVTDTYTGKEKLIHSLGLFYKCYKL